MGKKVFFFLILLIEIIICIAVCLKINTKEYESWIETEAYISDVLITGDVRSFRSNESTSITIMVKYLDNSEILRLNDYYLDCCNGDEILIKYNPDYQSEIIYLPYEEHCVYVKRRNTIIISICLIAVTIWFYWLKKRWLYLYSEVYIRILNL